MIYVASSWMNQDYENVVDALRGGAGFPATWQWEGGEGCFYSTS